VRFCQTRFPYRLEFRSKLELGFNKPLPAPFALNVDKNPRINNRKAHLAATVQVAHVQRAPRDARLTPRRRRLPNGESSVD
jgi:hypothetical protein